MLTEEQINENFEKYIGLIEKYITREGVDNLVKYLRARDMKTAPASTKYHGAYEGGLVVHCLNVYERLKKLLRLEFGEPYDVEGEMFDPIPYSDETIAIVALLHDISKVNYYTVEERNTKDANGNWIKVPFYKIKDANARFIFGSHSINSVYMVNKLIPLEYEEELAILHHMGGLDYTDNQIDAKGTTEAWQKSILAILLHHADMCSTFIDELEENVNE